MPAQTILITGASDGIGAAAARQLTAKGEHVVLIGRSRQKTTALAQELGTPFHLADFTELGQVRRLATELQADYGRIDVLANNAGGIMGKRELTQDGFEKTFQVNHLAPFLLTYLLLPTLIASSAKVIQTSSIAARLTGKLNIDDLQNEAKYAPPKAYGDTKLANILFTTELQRRYGPQGITAVAFHPGNVATNFASDTTHWIRFLYRTPLRRLITSPEQGAEHLTWLAEGTPGVTWVPGAYYEDHKIRKSHPQASDVGLARQLWDLSVAMLKLA